MSEITDTDCLFVISMWQPWATWVLWGWKTIETRKHSRFASLAGRRIGIHAAKRWDHKALELAAPFLTRDQLYKTRGFEHAHGTLIGTAFVTHFFDRLSPSKASQALIECFTDRSGLCLVGVNPFIPPIPMIGRQGIWRIPYPIRADSRPFAGNSSPSVSSAKSAVKS